jgi:hypothetical protein
MARLGSRLVRVIAIGLAAALVYAAPSATGRPHSPRPAASATIEVRAVPLKGFEVRDASRRQFGGLEFRGGLVLSSPARDFGGISSIRVEPDGQRFLAVTDKGNWLSGRIRYDGAQPAGIADATIAPMLGPDGRPITARHWYDSESLATDGATAYVGIERVHLILKFDRGAGGLAARGYPIAAPPEVKRLPRNQGLEGMVVAPRGIPLAGTLIAFSERGLDAAGNTRAFLIGGPTPGLFSVRRHDDGFDITDVAVTPRGDVLLLERRFSLLRGPGMRIRRLPAAAIRPGALVDGVTVMEADAGFQIDNMEGLSVHVGPRGETVLTVVSDDNFSFLQRTLLLQFTLLEP